MMPRMFPEAVSRTALLTAAARAAESELPAPLYDDPFAGRVAGAEGAALLAQHPARDRFVRAHGVKTRVFDDAIRAAVAAGAEQVLLPAAGLDTRAWRLNLPPGVRWFEVDHGPVLDHKARVLAGTPARVARVAVRFNLRGARLAEALAAAGFDGSKRTVVVPEGLLMYLEPADAEGLLARLAALVPAGSTLCADILNAAAVDPAGVLRAVLARFAAEGAPWRFGTDAPAALLGRAGWRVGDVVFAGHPRAWPERFRDPGAAPFSEPPRGVPVAWLVRAERTAD